MPGSGWRDRTGWPELDPLPLRVLPGGQGAVTIFRGLFLHYLEKAFAADELHLFSEHRHLHEPTAFRRYLAPTRDTEWVVYVKRPFAGPAQVLDYVERCTHRVAISNNRLVSIQSDRIRFRWKDYRDNTGRRS